MSDLHTKMHTASALYHRGAAIRDNQILLEGKQGWRLLTEQEEAEVLKALAENREQTQIEAETEASIEPTQAQESEKPDKAPNKQPMQTNLEPQKEDKKQTAKTIQEDKNSDGKQSQEKTNLNSSAILKRSIVPRMRDLAKNTRNIMINTIINRIDAMESIALETIEQENKPALLQELFRQFELQLQEEEKELTSKPVSELYSDPAKA